MKMINKFYAFLKDDQGGEIVEWVIVVAILAAIAVAAYNTTLRTAIEGAISTISGYVNPAP